MGVTSIYILNNVILVFTKKTREFRFPYHVLKGLAQAEKMIKKRAIDNHCLPTKLCRIFYIILFLKFILICGQLGENTLTGELRNFQLHQNQNDQDFNWEIPISLFDSNGLLIDQESLFVMRSDTGIFINHVLDRISLPPLFSVGALKISQNEKDKDHSPHHLFTFDLGNPRMNFFVKNIVWDAALTSSWKLAVPP